MPRGVHGSGPGSPSTSLPRLTGCSPSASLAGSARCRRANGSRPGGSGSWTRYPVHPGSAFSSSMTASTCAWLASAGRSRRMLAMPAFRLSRCLPLTSAWLPGSSPTSTVPSPGTRPSAARPATRLRRSSLMAAAVSRPSSTSALNTTSLLALAAGPALIRSLVVKVPGPGEVEADTGGLRRGDDLGVALGAAWFHDGTDPGVGEHPEAIGEREIGVAGGHRAAASLPAAGDRDPGRVDPVDLAH